MNIAIIVAAGAGRRFNGRADKLYLEILGKPLLAYALAAIEGANLVDEAVLVVGADKINYCQERIVERYNCKKVTQVISGGQYRQESVYLGLRALPKETRKVIVHDGGRPLIKSEKIDEVVRACSESAGAISAVPVSDTIKRVNKNLIITGTLDREKLWQAQTPQAFSYNQLLEAHQRAYEHGFIGTDDASVLEAMRQPVKIVEGDYDNIKITTGNDFIVAKALLLERAGMK